MCRPEGFSTRPQSDEGHIQSEHGVSSHSDPRKTRAFPLPMEYCVCSPDYQAGALAIGWWCSCAASGCWATSKRQLQRQHLSDKPHNLFNCMGNIDITNLGLEFLLRRQLTTCESMVRWAVFSEVRLEVDAASALISAIAAHVEALMPRKR